MTFRALAPVGESSVSPPLQGSHEKAPLAAYQEWLRYDVLRIIEVLQTIRCGKVEGGADAR
jgi:hypothetical protein